MTIVSGIVAKGECWRWLGAGELGGAVGGSGFADGEEVGEDGMLLWSGEFGFLCHFGQDAVLQVGDGVVGRIFKGVAIGTLLEMQVMAQRQLGRARTAVFGGRERGRRWQVAGTTGQRQPESQRSR